LGLLKFRALKYSSKVSLVKLTLKSGSRGLIQNLFCNFWTFLQILEVWNNFWNYLTKTEKEKDSTVHGPKSGPGYSAWPGGLPRPGGWNSRQAAAWRLGPAGKNDLCGALVGGSAAASRRQGVVGGLCDRTTSKIRGLSPKIISGDSRRSENAQTHINKHTIPNMKFKLKLLQIKCHVLGFTKMWSPKCASKDNQSLRKRLSLTSGTRSSP
jgi:hypothetical protein